MEFNGTFLATIISFLAFVFIMNKILYVPVRTIVNERRDLVEKNYSSASENDKEAEELTSQSEEKLVAAKEDARLKYNELLNEFKEKRTEVVQNARSEVSAELEEEYKILNNISNEAKEGLKNSMKDLAGDIVEKVLGYKANIEGFDYDAVNEILYRGEN